MIAMDAKVLRLSVLHPTGPPAGTKFVAMVRMEVDAGSRRIAIVLCVKTTFVNMIGNGKSLEDKPKSKTAVDLRCCA